MFHFSVGAQFGQTIFQAENGACLCPICRAKMRYGTLSDREDMILKLFRKTSESAARKGIEVTLTQVLLPMGWDSEILSANRVRKEAYW